MYRFKHTCPKCKGTGHTVSDTRMRCLPCDERMDIEPIFRPDDAQTVAAIIRNQNKLLEIQGGLIDSLRAEVAELKAGRKAPEPNTEGQLSEAVCGPFRNKEKQKEVNEQAVRTLYQYANEIERGARSVRMIEVRHEINTNIDQVTEHIKPFNQNASIMVEFHRSGVKG